MGETLRARPITTKKELQMKKPTQEINRVRKFSEKKEKYKGILKIQFERY
jgi:hypothetical protein